MIECSLFELQQAKVSSTGFAMMTLRQRAAIDAVEVAKRRGGGSVIRCSTSRLHRSAADWPGKSCFSRSTDERAGKQPIVQLVHAVAGSVPSQTSPAR